jgi:hypothetical protein
MAAVAVPATRRALLDPKSPVSDPTPSTPSSGGFIRKRTIAILAALLFFSTISVEDPVVKQILSFAPMANLPNIQGSPQGQPQATKAPSLLTFSPAEAVSAAASAASSASARPLTRHAVLLVGMAIGDAFECWPRIRDTFVDGDGKMQDAFVVLGLNGDGDHEPDEREAAVIDFLRKDPVVRGVRVDRRPFGLGVDIDTPIREVLPGYPYIHKTIQTGSPIDDQLRVPRVTLMLWKTLMAWESMVMAERAAGHTYEMVVRARTDVYLPGYAFRNRTVNLDAMARFDEGELKRHECDSVFYDSWGTDNPAVPADQLSMPQFKATNGQVALPRTTLGDGRIVRQHLFVSHYGLYAGGFNDYFAFGPRETMQSYCSTIKYLDEILELSMLPMVPEAMKKYSMLLHLRKLQEREEAAKGGAITYALHVHPCSQIVHCLTKWYETPLTTSRCKNDVEGLHWHALFDQA